MPYSKFFSLTAKTTLPILLILTLCRGPALGSGQTYFSIHLASFQHLRNANAQVNLLKEKGKTVFWEKINLPGKGEYYRVFIGHYPSRQAAVASWRKLRKQGAVSYFGIFEFRKSNKIPGQTVLPGIPAPLEALKPPGEPRPGPLLQRFVDNRDGTITELKTNLMWIKNGWRLDFVSAVTWPEALKKCNAFRLGGYGNWRLSGVEEWRSLIDTGNQAPALVEPNPFENIIVHMPYWTRTEFAGGSEVPLTPGISVRAYTVMLYSGNIIHQKKTDRAFILPVRSIP